jgi:hypothetical protein
LNLGWITNPTVEGHIWCVIFRVDRAGIEKNLTLQQPFINRTKMDPNSKLPENHINPHLVHQDFEIL